MDALIKLKSHGREDPLEEQTQGHKLVFEWLNKDFSRLPMHLWSEELTTNGCKSKTLWRAEVYILNYLRKPNFTKIFVMLNRTDEREFSVTPEFTVSLINNKQEVLFKNTCSSVFPSEDTSRKASLKMLVPNMTFSSLPNGILNIRIDTTINGCCDLTVSLYDALKRNGERSIAERRGKDPHLLRLMRDFGKARENNLLGDFYWNIDQEVIRANKFVLSARSPVFKRMFESTDISYFEYYVTGENKKALEAFTSYLYTAYFENISMDTMCKLYSFASLYEVNFLQKTCGICISSNVSATKVYELLILAHTYRDDGVKNAVMDFIVENFSQVQFTPLWIKLVNKFPNLPSEVDSMLGY